MLKNNTEKANVLLFGEMIQFKYFFIVLTLFSATWLIANIAAVKLVSVFGVVLTGGFIIFPITTMLSNIIVEVYGYKNARQAIWAGFILNLSFIFFINIVNVIPSSPYWKLEEQFKNILIPETRIILASLISFLLSDFSNSYLMAKMKLKNKGKSLIKRILISSGTSISIDIICFMMLAFFGTMPVVILIKLICAAFIKKYCCQILLLPFIWYLIDCLKSGEGIEIFDYDTKFNPFAIENIYELNSIREFNSKRKESISSSIIHEK